MMHAQIEPRLSRLEDYLEPGSVEILTIGERVTEHVYPRPEE